MEFNLDNILRNNIKTLKKYSSARDEFKGKEGVFLDANENSFGSPLKESYNRYPDPMQLDVKDKLSKIKGLPIQNIFLGNGSDEAIDILFRAFCEPGKDNVIICPPTYGMYEVSAGINDVNILKVPLLPETFQLNVDGILKAINKNTKLIFFCCPNNPTGNGVKWNDIKTVLDNFSGIVVIDEAYINFAKYRSLIPELLNYPNLVILQTLSKAWGLAGLRIGMAFASEPIIDIFNKIKPPYNVNAVSQKLALEALDNIEQINNWIKEVVEERDKVISELQKFSFVQKVYPSDANFILVKTNDPGNIYNYLVSKKVIVRDRSSVELCEGCLRITIGTKEENLNLLSLLNAYK
ncbi:MAG: histidinol-phosphate transaminase [Sphingobacteriaceae bacterium]|nr:histidinol-phosphate transaminase [Sphingobacteriaceae bacterium]